MALIHVNFFSDVLGMASQMEVILPQKNDSQIGIAHNELEHSIPVLYLLHGMTDNHTTWMRNTSIERYASERGIAVVMPNAHLSWYTNMQFGFDYFDYIAEEIPSVLRRFFPAISTSRQDTFIAGNSMGGYGAFLHGLTCPDRFAGIASLSGGLDAYEIVKANPAPDFGAELWKDIFGNTEEIPGSDHDLFYLSENLHKGGLQKPSIWMWCGYGDFLYECNVKMQKHLEALNWPLTYNESDGDHSWHYWDIQIPHILDWMLEVRNHKERQ